MTGATGHVCRLFSLLSALISGRTTQTPHRRQPPSLFGETTASQHATCKAPRRTNPRHRSSRSHSGPSAVPLPSGHIIVHEALEGLLHSDTKTRAVGQYAANLLRVVMPLLLLLSDPTFPFLLSCQISVFFFFFLFSLRFWDMRVHVLFLAHGPATMTSGLQRFLRLPRRSTRKLARRTGRSLFLFMIPICTMDELHGWHILQRRATVDRIGGGHHMNSDHIIINLHHFCHSTLILPCALVTSDDTGLEAKNPGQRVGVSNDETLDNLRQTSSETVSLLSHVR